MDILFINPVFSLLVPNFNEERLDAWVVILHAIDGFKTDLKIPACKYCQEYVCTWVFTMDELYRRFKFWKHV